MPFTLILAASTAVSSEPLNEPSHPPVLRHGDSVVGFQDYPLDALKRREYGVVSIVLVVTPEGRVASCHVTESSGSQSLDKQTCNLMQSRARFVPATNGAGSPVFAQYRTSVAWGVENHQPTTNIRFKFIVAQLPEGYRAPTKARLTFNSAGHLDRCDMERTSGSIAADEAACAYAKANLITDAPKSEASSVTPSAIRYMIVSLSPDKQTLGKWNLKKPITKTQP